MSDIRAFIPDPIGLEFRAWGALVAEQLAANGVSAPTNDGWREWGSQLLMNPQLAAIPEPYGFNDWREWARRLLETIL